MNFKETEVIANKLFTKYTHTVDVLDDKGFAKTETIYDKITVQTRGKYSWSEPIEITKDEYYKIASNQISIEDFCRGI